MEQTQKHESVGIEVSDINDSFVRAVAGPHAGRL